MRHASSARGSPPALPSQAAATRTTQATGSTGRRERSPTVLMAAPSAASRPMDRVRRLLRRRPSPPPEQGLGPQRRGQGTRLAGRDHPQTPRDMGPGPYTRHPERHRDALPLAPAEATHVHSKQPRTQPVGDGKTAARGQTGKGIVRRPTRGSDSNGSVRGGVLRRCQKMTAVGSAYISATNGTLDMCLSRPRPLAVRRNRVRVRHPWTDAVEAQDSVAAADPHTFRHAV